MSRGRRLFSCLIGGALAASLAACGGGSSPSTPTPTPTPVPTPPPPRVVAQGSGVSVPVGWAMGEYFDIAATGTLEATVDYTFDQVVFSQTTAGGAPAASARRSAEPGFLTRLPASARP